MSMFFPSTPSTVSSLNREHSTLSMNHFHNTQAAQSLRTPTHGVGTDHSSLATPSRSSSYPMLPPAQPRPQALTSLLNLSEQSRYEQPGYGPTDYQDIDTGLGGHGLGGDPLIITDKDYRSSLHSILKIAPDMAKGHMQLTVYQTGLMYAILKECRAISKACHSDRTIMSDVHTRLEETFMFTPEQKVNIHLVSGELLLDPNQVCYTQMSIDVEIRICERQRDLHFFHIFGNLACQRLRGTMIQRTCSSLQNAYWEMLCDSVIGPNTLTLDDFVINLTNRFPSSLPSQVLLGRKDEIQEDDKKTPSTSRSESTQPDIPDEDISRPSSAMSGTTSQHNGKKRKRAGNSLPHLKGNDFWSMVEKWFASHMQQNRLGTSWTSPGWTKYIEEMLQRDRKRFKPIPILNPFLADFDDVPGGAGDDNGVAQPHTSSAIGSMQAIIRIL
ncbi:hypothetical protein EDB92DRAFT_1821066 [Lactarius akahatsu]|uniref:Uncharacterized protein n=1 Tax=Lactarius akahatsu TaxID=416441 RepID=A0AAD4L704_9AGAM|nr:hypothetical protein EDB92DRAFT_1821066 [Lactarius akahatsu]